MSRAIITLGIRFPFAFDFFNIFNNFNAMSWNEETSTDKFWIHALNMKTDNHMMKF